MYGELNSEDGERAWRRGKGLMLAAVLAGSSFAWASSAYPTLVLSVSDNNAGPVPGTTTTGPGTLSFSGSNPFFTAITVNVSGDPLLATPNLRTVVEATAAPSLPFSATLTIVAMQTGISFPGANGTGSAELTFNGLVGAPGPVFEDILVNGAATSLSSLFPAGNGFSGLIFDFISMPAVTTVAEEFEAAFTSGGQTLEATIDFSAIANIPEPTSLALLNVALVGLALIRRRKQV